MQPLKQVSCIIPFYNEGDRIFSVLEVALRTPGIGQIICVDDGSTDDTASKIRKEYPHIDLVYLQENQGKAAAIRHGLEMAVHDLILLMDADLQYVNPDEITLAIEGMQHQDIDMVILRRIYAPWIFKIDRRDVLFSGERLMRRKDLQNILQQQVYGYQLEIAINRYMLQHNKNVRWAPWSALNTHKVKKWGFFYGARKEVMMFLDMILYTGLSHYVKQIISFARKKLEVEVVSS